jgi:hypothetical protein
MRYLTPGSRKIAGDGRIVARFHIAAWRIVTFRLSGSRDKPAIHTTVQQIGLNIIRQLAGGLQAKGLAERFAAGNFSAHMISRQIELEFEMHPTGMDHPGRHTA